MERDYLLKGIPAATGPIHAIKQQICLKYGISMTELLSRRRLRKLAEARFEGYWRARNETTASLPEIARAFGRSDHATIIHGIARYEAGMPNGPANATGAQRRAAWARLGETLGR